MVVKVKFDSGTTTATEARISLPPNLTSGTVNALTLLGPYARNTNAATANQVYIENAVSYITMGRADGSLVGYTKRNGNDICSSGEIIGFTTAPFPIAEWAGLYS
jgi:hypothetical protein